MLPALFISHGAPTLALSNTPAHRFLQELGATLPRPKAIVVASAHWETPTPWVSGEAQTSTIYDFRGFPRALYEMRYPAPGDPALAARIADLLEGGGMPAGIDPERGLDHGAWVPLSLMYPAADIPVVQVSLQTPRGPIYHHALGQALAPLRAENVLIVGSGSFTHDLGRFHGQDIATPPPSDVDAAAAWLDAALMGHRTEDLLAYRRLSPETAANHPTEEHLLPLFVALGAALGAEGTKTPVRRLHSSSEYGILSMDAYAFGAT